MFERSRQRGREAEPSEFEKEREGGESRVGREYRNNLIEILVSDYIFKSKIYTISENEAQDQKHHLISSRFDRSRKNY